MAIIKKHPSIRDYVINSDHPLIVVSWDMKPKFGPGYKVTDVRAALEKHGLPPVALDIRPRSAMLKALRDAESQSRDLAILEDTPARMVFQLTNISAEEDAKYGKIAKYLAHAHITFNKATQELECSNPQVQKYLEARFAEFSAYYETNDVTRQLQKIILQNNIGGDYINLKGKSGVYLMSAAFEPLVEKMLAFVKDLHPDNSVWSFPVKATPIILKQAAAQAHDRNTEALHKLRADLEKVREISAERRASGTNKQPLDERSASRKTRLDELTRLENAAKLWARTTGYVYKDFEALLQEVRTELNETFSPATQKQQK